MRRWIVRSLLMAIIATVVVVGLVVILIAVPITRRFIIVAFAEWMLGGRMEDVAVDLDIQPGLRWIFTTLVILPVGFGLARMVIARNFNSAFRGLALAAGTLLLLGVVTWWHTRHFNFDAKGRPVVFLSFRRDGVHKSYSSGIDRVTGRPKYEASLDRVLWLSELAKQPVRDVDPAVEHNWFDANSGEPNLWYAETGTNQCQFYNRPHFHQQLRIEVSPITPELMARWQIEHNRRESEAKAVRIQQDAAAKVLAEEVERSRKDNEQIELEARQRQEAEEAAKREIKQRQEIELANQKEAEEAAKRESQQRQGIELANQIETRRIAECRAQESLLPPNALRLFEAPQMLRQVFPDLTADSYTPKVLSQEYLMRRFRFVGKLTQVEKATQKVTCEPIWVGNILYTVEASMTSTTFKDVRVGKNITIAGTLVNFRLANEDCEANGIRGRACKISFGNATVVAPEPVIPPKVASVKVASVKPTVAKTTSSSDPLFVSPSQFSNNDIVTGTIGFTIENGVRLVFAPLRLFSHSTTKAYSTPTTYHTTPAYYRQTTYSVSPTYYSPPRTVVFQQSPLPVYRYVAPPQRVVWQSSSCVPRPCAPPPPRVNYGQYHR